MAVFGEQEIFPQKWEDMTLDELDDQQTKVINRLETALTHRQHVLIPLFQHYNATIKKIKEGREEY